MGDTKSISKRTHTSVRLKRTESRRQPVPGAEPANAPKRRRNARTGRVEAMRVAIQDANFDLDVTFAQALRKMIERELD